MEDLVKYLIIAILAGGAIPIIISYLTKRSRKRKKKDRNC